MVKAAATRWALMSEALVGARNLERSDYSVRSVAVAQMAHLVAAHSGARTMTLQFLARSNLDLVYHVSVRLERGLLVAGCELAALAEVP